MAKLRILVRAPNWIGDHVMALPLYRGLRANYPQAHLSLMGPESVMGLPLPVVFDSYHRLKKRERSGWEGIKSSAMGFRGHFDLGISLPASFSSALWLAQARIPQRVGFSFGPSRILLDHSLDWPKVGARRHRSELYLEILGLLKPDLDTEPFLKPESGSGEREALILVAPGASQALRVWPHFEALVESLQTRYQNHRIVLVGGAGESCFSERLMSRRFENVESRVGQTSLEELVALCRRAGVVVANDSGVAHIAASLGGAPTVVVFGPGNPGHVCPSGPEVKVARISKLPCVPCERPRCAAPFGYQRCLTDLSLDRVQGLTEECLS